MEEWGLFVGTWDSHGEKQAGKEKDVQNHGFS